MKIYARAINLLQLINAEGYVRICRWRRNNIIGNILEENIQNILHGEKAKK